MESSSPQAHPSSEMGPNRAPVPAQAEGESVLRTSERGQPTPEVKGPAGGIGSEPPSSMPQMPILPTPTARAIVQQPTLPSVSPTSASDEDVIEKEWVDKAKRIVNETRNDPYTQEKEVSKLQADYLKKRYGKEIKLSSD